MITDVRLYEVLHAYDYYELNENGEQLPNPCGDLIYTDDWHFLVEWYDKDISLSAQEQRFENLEDALKLYKEMKVKENKK